MSKRDLRAELELMTMRALMRMYVVVLGWRRFTIPEYWSVLASYTRCKIMISTLKYL